jgi:glycosyltransferase involved in cell wall biosynthesis
MEEGLRLFHRGSREVLRLARKLAYFFLPPVIYSALKWALPRVIQAGPRQHLRELMTPHLARLLSGDGRPSEPAARAYRDHVARLRKIHETADTDPAVLDEGIEAAAKLFSGHLFDRVRTLRELARLAELRGQEPLACAYSVRAIRLLGTDLYHDLPRLTAVLQRLRFDAEAAALIAMYEDPGHAPERCQRILESALVAHRRPPEPIPFERFEDHRHAEIPRVAVIVSLYKAASKLPTFLHALRSQSMVLAQQLELIFVDSGSPADEYGALTRTLFNFSLPYLYVRTAVRESIQTAWNRGIALARAPYLTFLGVDETLTPGALAILADALDSDPTVDWVQGDSLLTEVDDKGSWVRDIMTYDREGYTRNHVLLETCYLSWVGAMYRRSVHDRFGYYDGSFRATGDNEFKCRVLPFINTQRIPRLLGVFINYPEPRATGSPIAELEDTRAWYLHRTLGGVRYAMQGREPAEVEKLLLLALRYRKSYTTHLSSDVEYAANVAAHLRERLPSSPLLALTPGIDRLLFGARLHDHPDHLTVDGFATALGEAHATWAAVQGEHRSSPWLRDVKYSFARDNRHEQHSFTY